MVVYFQGADPDANEDYDSLNPDSKETAEEKKYRQQENAIKHKQEVDALKVQMSDDCNSILI